MPYVWTLSARQSPEACSPGASHNRTPAGQPAPKLGTRFAIRAREASLARSLLHAGTRNVRAFATRARAKIHARVRAKVHACARAIISRAEARDRRFLADRRSVIFFWGSPSPCSWGLAAWLQLVRPKKRETSLKIGLRCRGTGKTGRKRKHRSTPTIHTSTHTHEHTSTQEHAHEHPRAHQQNTHKHIHISRSTLAIHTSISTPPTHTHIQEYANNTLTHTTNPTHHKPTKQEHAHGRYTQEHTYRPNPNQPNPTTGEPMDTETSTLTRSIAIPYGSPLAQPRDEIEAVTRTTFAQIRRESWDLAWRQVQAMRATI